MLRISLGTSRNGYPTIVIDPPYEIFGEYLRAEYTPQRVSDLLASLQAVVSGQSKELELWQDCAKLTLNHAGSTACVWLENLAIGVEEQSAMPLQEFLEIVVAWKEHVDHSA